MFARSGGRETRYIIGAVILLIISVVFIKSSFDVLKSKERLDEINSELSSLNEEKEKIEKEIEYKQTDGYVEEKARNELNLIKPGEKVYVVVEEGSESVVLSETDEIKQDEKEEIDKKKQKNWYLWYRLFFDN
jgi:cell division protein FtsB